MLWVAFFFFLFFLAQPTLLGTQLSHRLSQVLGSLSVWSFCGSRSRDLSSAAVNPEEYLHNVPCFHCLPSLKGNGGSQDAHTPRTTENDLSQHSLSFCSCPEDMFVRLQPAKKLLELGFSIFCLTFLTVFLISWSPCQRHQGLNFSKTRNPSLSESRRDLEIFPEGLYLTAGVNGLWRAWFWNYMGTGDKVHKKLLLHISRWGYSFQKVQLVAFLTSNFYFIHVFCLSILKWIWPLSHGIVLFSFLTNKPRA